MKNESVLGTQHPPLPSMPLTSKHLQLSTTLQANAHSTKENILWFILWAYFEATSFTVKQPAVYSNF